MFTIGFKTKWITKRGNTCVEFGEALKYYKKTCTSQTKIV